MKKQTDITMFPKPYASPPNKSPAPYLAYELDQLRKQQKKCEIQKKYIRVDIIKLSRFSFSTSKNLNMLESAMQSAKMKNAYVLNFIMI